MSIEVEDEPKAGAPEWMVTFADLMSLLLTFFVLLLSFSTTEMVKFRQLAGSLREAFGMRSELEISNIPKTDQLLPTIDPEPSPATAKTAEQVREKLGQMLQEMGLEKEGGAEVTPDGVVLQLSGDLFFESGKATLNPNALEVLDEIAEQLQTTRHDLDIVGHTDNLPISTRVYPSNWELSAARAGQAVRYLTEKGVAPERLRAIGHAQTAPIATNETAEGRAENRRIEFVFRVPEADTSPVESVQETSDE